MFTEMRRKDRALSQEETAEILNRVPFGVLATVGTDGYPYGVPLSFAYEDGKIYLHCAANAGMKEAAMAADPHVCFTVIGDTQVMPEKFGTKFESVIVFGTASRLSDAEKQKALEALIRKYSSAYWDSGLAYIKAAFEKADTYAIQIEHMTGKAKRG